MTPPNSEMVQAEYLIAAKAIGSSSTLRDSELGSSPQWYHHLPGFERIVLFLKHEPERSLRVARLVAAPRSPRFAYRGRQGALR